MRVLPALLILLAASWAGAQSNEATSAPASSSRQAKTAPAKRSPIKVAPKKAVAPKAAPAKEEGLFARARAWATRTAYAYDKGGRAYAEGLVRKMPKTFAAVKNEVTGLSKRVAKSETLRDLDQKRAYVAELWRLRASLDLMALLEPGTLETITGIDARLFQSLRANLASVAQTLGVGRTPIQAPGKSVTKTAPKG